MAIRYDNRFDICSVELELPEPSYIINTIELLYKKHLEHEFVIIMDTDNLESYHKWKDHEK
jgi:nicotinate-nucleotide adenylyltransferase